MALLIQPLQSVYDNAGNRVLDACLFVYVAGTTTPVPCYVDSGLSNRHPMPIPARGNGVLPVVYVAPGTYDLLFTDPYGGVYDNAEDLVIAAPSSGGGGGGTVDPLTIFRTGFILDRYGTGTLPGFVRLNGRTIGSSASAGSERANDDAHDLFVFLWSQDANLAVAGGRGSNAESDWAAAKTIALPDQAGRLRVGLDDLGGGAKGRLNGGLFTFGNATTLGSYGGEASHVQTLAELAAHGTTVTATMDAQGLHQHTGSTDAAQHQHQYSTASLKNITAGSGAQIFDCGPGRTHRPPRRGRWSPTPSRRPRPATTRTTSPPRRARPAAARR